MSAVQSVSREKTVPWSALGPSSLQRFLLRQFLVEETLPLNGIIMSLPMFLFVRLPSRSTPFTRRLARMWWFIPQFPGRKRGSSMTVIKTFLTQQGTPLRSSAIGLRLGLHGLSSWSRQHAVRVCGVHGDVRGKSGQRDVEGVFIKQFTKTIDCGAQPGCGCVF